MAKYTRFKFHKQWLDLILSFKEKELSIADKNSVIVALCNYGIDSNYKYDAPSADCKIIFSFFSQEIDRERNNRCKISERKKEDIINERNTEEYKTWRKSVFMRDDFICQCCHKKGGELEAHHLRPYSKFKEQRFDIANGITLCKKCHKAWHKKFGINPKEIFLI